MRYNRLTYFFRNKAYAVLNKCNISLFRKKHFSVIYERDNDPYINGLLCLFLKCKVGAVKGRILFAFCSNSRSGKLGLSTLTILNFLR